MRLANLCITSLLIFANLGLSFAEEIARNPPTISFPKISESTSQGFECNLRSSYEELELTDIIDITLCSSPLLRKGNAGIREQTAARGIGASRYWPTLTADVNGSKFQKSVEYDNSPFANYALSGKSRNTSLSLNWILFDSGLRKANYENVSHLLNAAYFDRSDVIRNTIISSTEAFYKAQSASAAVIAAKESELTAAQSAQTAIAMLREGAGSITDMLLAQGSLDQVILRRIQVESDQRTAFADLASILGLPRSVRISVFHKVIESPTPQFDIDVEAVVRTDLNQSPRLNFYREQVRAAAARVIAARAEGMPTLSLVGSTYKNLTPQDESTSAQRINGWTLGLQLRIPLFDGFGRENGVVSALAQMDGKQAELDAAAREVETQIWSSQETLRRETQRISIVDRIVQNAKKAFEAAKTRYATGVGSILELLKSQSDVADARQQWIKTYSEWQTAKIRFAVSIGRLEDFDFTLIKSPSIEP